MLSWPFALACHLHPHISMKNHVLFALFGFVAAVPAVAQQGLARYQLTFQTTWSAQAPRWCP